MGPKSEKKSYSNKYKKRDGRAGEIKKLELDTEPKGKITGIKINLRVRAQVLIKKER